MSIVHELLAQTTNHVGWVVAGLIAWGFAYWQLEDIGSRALGDVVTLILSIIPLGIAAIAIDVAVARWNRSDFEVAFFVFLAVASLLYFAAVYFGLTQVGERSEVQRVINDFKVLQQVPQKTVTLVIQLLVGAISTLACATLLIFGGWQLIQGFRTVGLSCGLIGVALVLFSRRPERDWNYLWLWRAKLKRTEGTGIPAAPETAKAGLS
jgi:hypothetical protein